MISPSTAGRYDFDDRSERHFLALGHQQCLDLMEAHHLGRVAWQAADSANSVMAASRLRALRQGVSQSASTVA